jgi:very-short-patch-repair endonuclease
METGPATFQKIKNPVPDWWPLLRLHLLAHGLPIPVLEYRFHPVRRWRFDAAFIEQRIALEIDGGLFIGGRHTRGAGAERDMEKFAEAMILGWRVLRVSPGQLKSGQAALWLASLLLKGRPIAR